tara:strand:+ start:313 stop:705 length:393 start_codon:yes stop_codon:yes gene_type:complete
MPSIHILVTSTTQTVTIPQHINAAHLHLKMVSARLSKAPASDNRGLEISLPFMKHMFQFASTTGRSNIIIPLADDKVTTVYPDVVFVGEEIPSSFQVKLLDPSDGTTWSDSTNATIGCVHVVLEYSKKVE